MRKRALAAIAAAVILTGCGSATRSVTPESNNPTSLVSQTPTSSPTPSSAAAVTIVLSGELFFQDATWKAAQTDAGGADSEYNFAAQLGGVKDIVSEATVAICHNEVPIAAQGRPVSGFPAYSVPHQVATAIADTGFDICTVNSEHSLDHGLAGLDATVTALRDRGVATAGAYRSAKESQLPNLIDVDGVKVAVVSGTESRGSSALPTDKLWAVDMMNADAMIAQARAARDAGAQIVVAAMHAGSEYTSTPSKNQQTIAAKLAAAPEIDVVYGHGAHAVQPIVSMNGTWVLYGLGTLVAQPSADKPVMNESILARVTFTPDKLGYSVSSVGYLPTVIDTSTEKKTLRVMLTKDALAAGGNPAKYQDSLERIQSVVGSPSGLTVL